MRLFYDCIPITVMCSMFFLVLCDDVSILPSVNEQRQEFNDDQILSFLDDPATEGLLEMEMDDGTNEEYEVLEEDFFLDAYVASNEEIDYAIHDVQLLVSYLMQYDTYK